MMSATEARLAAFEPRFSPEALTRWMRGKALYVFARRRTRALGIDPDDTTWEILLGTLTDNERADYRASFVCWCCGEDHGIYMVHNRVWRAAGMIGWARVGFLCLPCLEARLGRPLARPDFTNAPCNPLAARVVPELRERLEREP